MKIQFNKDDQNKLTRLIQTKEENIAVAELFNEIFNNEITFDNCDNLPDVLNRIAELFEMDTQDSKTQYILSYVIGRSISTISLNEYNKNDYKNVVKPKEIASNNTFLQYLRYESNSLIPIDDIQVDEQDYFREYSSIGFIKEDYDYLSLIKDKKIWMCVIPNEIKTMDRYIKKAKGRVITFGLGLGYYAFMASLKKEVSQITIVEKDHDVINLFNKYLLPLFPNKEKIKLIADDAFLYLKKNPRLSGFDYAFFDLWHNAEDGLPLYIKLKKYDFTCDSGYWLEESLVALYRRCYIQVIQESLEGFKVSNYKFAKTKIDAIINSIYFKTANQVFTKYEDVKKALTRDKLVQMMSN